MTAKRCACEKLHRQYEGGKGKAFIDRKERKARRDREFDELIGQRCPEYRDAFYFTDPQAGLGDCGKELRCCNAIHK